MITMSELLADTTYREYLLTIPKIPKPLRDPSLSDKAPWVIFVQKNQGGPWGKKSFWKYSEAFAFFKKCLELKVYDLAFNCRKTDFGPPTKVVRIKGRYHTNSNGKRVQVTREVKWHWALPESEMDHFWCRYCRRPTEFKYYSRHKNFPADFLIDRNVMRCCICGASERIALRKEDNR
jgi:hypothetical protein